MVCAWKNSAVPCGEAHNLYYMNQNFFVVSNDVKKETSTAAPSYPESQPSPSLPSQPSSYPAYQPSPYPAPQPSVQPSSYPVPSVGSSTPAGSSSDSEITDSQQATETVAQPGAAYPSPNQRG